jgi:arylsulfatase A-like enzyme
VAEGGWDRRTFIKRGALAAAGLVGFRGFGGARATPGARRTARLRPSHPAQPNILTIIVDQLRTPVWMPASLPPTAVMPNVAALGERSVSFDGHYTAANDCSPSRSVLLTGLYTHQTGVMVTGSGWLDPRFPTWGTLLRKLGYQTAYYGKWHLNPNANAPLEQYGFVGGTYPSPNGGPGQGTRVDPSIADQFLEWFEGHSESGPWATTVSFVNPHDIAWWHRFTEAIEAEAHPPARALAMPPNFETPEQLAAKQKPLLQRALQQTMAQSFGAVPFTGPEAPWWWTQMMDTYLLVQSYVDVQVGRVLATLASEPAIAANTIVIFTSDHGEYGGSHGMRGKGASAYEEAIRVPLYVYDPRGMLASAPELPRTQLTSSADVVGLMLTIATGSDAWRGESEFAHLANRLDLARLCAHPHAPGRSWILHATDEDVTEFAAQPYVAEAPRHVVAVRTPDAKLVLYSNWRAGTIEVEAAGHESEFYEYANEEGRMELTSQDRSGSPLEDRMWQTLESEAIPDELRAPLPKRLQAARREAMAKYFAQEEREALKAYEAHQRHATEPTVESL